MDAVSTSRLQTNNIPVRKEGLFMSANHTSARSKKSLNICDGHPSLLALVAGIPMVSPRQDGKSPSLKTSDFGVYNLFVQGSHVLSRG